MIEDDLIDEIEVIWKNAPPWSGTRVKNPIPELRVINDYFYRTTWSDIPSILNSIRIGYSLDINGSGFDFQDGKVLLYDLLDEIEISKNAFLRLICRFFVTLYNGASQHQESVIQEKWWTDFSEAVKQFETTMTPF
ncbi:MAG TPA: hypothetical protein VK184_17580 [Nostocaceae cyanobacterium]|nr:hypothetical protein [Nostocaceae cyanobacterium]